MSQNVMEEYKKSAHKNIIEEFKKLTPEQQAHLTTLKTAEEMLAYAEEKGITLTEEAANIALQLFSPEEAKKLLQDAEATGSSNCVIPPPYVSDYCKCGGTYRYQGNGLAQCDKCGRVVVVYMI